MIHPMVLQLRFTRSEFKRAIDGVTDEESRKRFLPMNCISWHVGHLAWQEQRYFLLFAQGKILLPEINKQFAYGAPHSTPSLEEMWSGWKEIISAVDPWLDQVTSEILLSHVMRDGKETQYIYGSLLQRVIYHYWYHTGENMTIRKLLGHTGLPFFVGNIDEEAPYKSEH